MTKEDLGACPASPATALAPPSGVKPQEGLEQSRSSTGATPGPWEARRARHPDNTGGYDYAIAAGGKIIAEAFEHVGFVAGTPVYDARPVKANAHLIAAAPDMFEALARFVALLDKGEGYLSFDAEQAMRAALAKARGEVK